VTETSPSPTSERSFASAASSGKAAPAVCADPLSPSYWCCARWEPDRERLALDHLQRTGFETYYPIIRAQRRIGVRRFEGSAGLFGLYGFVLIRTQWYNARWAPGVAALIIGADGRPAKVGDEIIARLREREDEQGFIVLHKGPVRPEFERGDKLRIIQGAFTGHIVLYEGMTTRQRIEVLLTMLGAERRVSVARADVRAEPVQAAVSP
jgi:transcription antitermination factor NusG